MDFTGTNILAIRDLIVSSQPDVDSDEDKPESGIASRGPGDIGPPKQKSNTNNQKEKKHTKNIWDEDEVPEGAEYEAFDDPRPQPEYEILFKQAVTSEDIYLQMGNKTPLTSSCEEMVVKIHLPDTKMAEVDLDVKEKFLDLRSPKFKLGLHLPHPVDHKNGKAQWDSKTATLHVALRMNRELDIFNF